MRIDKRLKIAIAAVVIAACAFGGYTYYQSQQKAKQAAAVETAEVVRKDLKSTVSATGTISPVDSVEVSPKITARISQVLVKENDHVTAGQTVAILDGKDMDERIPEIIGDAVEAVVAENCPAKVPSDDWDAKAVELWAANMTGRDDFSVAEVDHDDDPAVLSEALEAYLEDVFASKSEQLGEPVMKMLEGQVMLRMIDTRWMAHLQEMDYLKAGIGLRAFGQRDPLVEYKNEAYNAFQNLTAGMYEDYLRTLLRLQVAVKQEQPALAEDKSPLDGKVSYSSPEQALEQTGVGAARKQAAASPSGARRLRQAAAAKPRRTRRTRTIPSPTSGATSRAPAARVSSTRSVTDEINKESWLIETKKTWRR